jgi:hypothetical protein
MATKKAAIAPTNEIYINEIEFHGRDEVQLFGFLHTGGKFRETRFLISRKDLQTLLSENGQPGIEILWQIEKLFAYPHSEPASLNLVELFGTTQAFKADLCDFTQAPKTEPDNWLSKQLCSLKYYFL